MREIFVERPTNGANVHRDAQAVLTAHPALYPVLMEDATSSCETRRWTMHVGTEGTTFSPSAGPGTS